MGKIHSQIDEKLRSFIEAQRMFFVATAPLNASGHVNLSPKGLDTFRVLGPRSVGYLDYVGSGAETIAHLRENGRITIMLCAFEGPPQIVRLHGEGKVLEPQDSEYQLTRPLFPDAPSPRAIIHVSVHRIADTCGYSVPLYEFQGHRSQLTNWCERKGEEGLQNYQIENNATSIDGLAALRWVDSNRA